MPNRRLTVPFLLAAALLVLSLGGCSKANPTTTEPRTNSLTRFFGCLIPKKSGSSTTIVVAITGDPQHGHIVGSRALVLGNGSTPHLSPLPGRISITFPSRATPPGLKGEVLRQPLDRRGSTSFRVGPSDWRPSTITQLGVTVNQDDAQQVDCKAGLIRTVTRWIDCVRMIGSHVVREYTMLVLYELVQEGRVIGWRPSVIDIVAQEGSRDRVTSLDIGVEQTQQPDKGHSELKRLRQLPDRPVSLGDRGLVGAGIRLHVQTDRLKGGRTVTTNCISEGWSWPPWQSVRMPR
jgi:hypothetical protein